MNPLKRAAALGALFGIDLRRLGRSLLGAPRYAADFARYLNDRRAQGMADFPLGHPYPCLHEWSEQSGTASGAYFHQDLLVAQRVWERSPRRHVDVGSRVDGFVAHLATFRPVEVVDLRPLRTSARNIRFVQQDACRLSPQTLGMADSVSCLHALEHFGLGRYGDRIDATAHVRGWRAIASIVEPGGWAYLSVPIGARQRVEFNAHRVFSLPALARMVQDGFELKNLHYVDDDGELHLDAPTEGPRWEETFGLRMGCGILELQKRVGG